MNIFFKIKASYSKDRKYLFCNCCFVYGDIVVGDYEQTVLAETLKISFEDLLLKLEDYELIRVDENNIEDVFNVFSDDINRSCLPTFIESFDGDFGILCNINNKESLIIKKWGCVDIIKIEINKKDYIDLILDALKKIDN